MAEVAERAETSSSDSPDDRRGVLRSVMTYLLVNLWWWAIPMGLVLAPTLALLWLMSDAWPPPLYTEF